MSNIELKRDHEGRLHIYVAGVPAHGALVTGMQSDHITVAIPLKHATFGEVTNVVPFKVPDINLTTR